MGVFTQNGAALEWRGRHETVRIGPWGRNSLRVRGTMWQAIRDDLPGALLDPPPASADIEIPAGQAQITNGGLTAEISGNGQLRFLRTGGRELLSETTTRSSAGCCSCGNGCVPTSWRRCGTRTRPACR
jgi:alpha-D-xyloside xylohydrolase